MSSLALILAWKFNNVPGIRTREKRDGTFEIFEWPNELGPLPSEADLRQWSVEYETRKAPAEAILVAEYQEQIARYLTPGKDQIYVRKEREASAWTRASAPRKLTTYPFALAEAAALNGIDEASVTEADVQAVVDVWSAKVDYWLVQGVAIEKEYIRSGAAIAAATTPAELRAAMPVWPA